MLFHLIPHLHAHPSPGNYNYFRYKKCSSSFLGCTLAPSKRCIDSWLYTLARPSNCSPCRPQSRGAHPPARDMPSRWHSFPGSPHSGHNHRSSALNIPNIRPSDMSHCCIQWCRTRCIWGQARDTWTGPANSLALLSHRDWRQGLIIIR